METNAAGLLDQGRALTLQSWVGLLPPEQVTRSPDLLYWLACASRPHQPAQFFGTGRRPLVDDVAMIVARLNVACVLAKMHAATQGKDAVDGAIMNCYLALIYARVGEKELALPLIERLLKTPGAVDSVDYSITVNDLKHRWEWDPIRNDPRFQKLVSSHP